jgi:hypothetical protein
VGLSYKTYLLHRLAVQYMTGEWPMGEVDHMNGNKADNRWANLRVVSSKMNKENRRDVTKRKSRGRLLGATPLPSGRWAAYITHNYKNHFIGTYDTEEEAHNGYLQRKREIHAGFLG